MPSRDSDPDSGDGSDLNRGSDPESDPSDDPGGSPPEPGDSAPADPSPSFGFRLRRNWERAVRNLPLALVPLASSLVAVDNVRRVVTFEEAFHLGATFQFPSALPDLWSFVSVPTQEAGIHVSPTPVFLPVIVAVRATLLAGLLGSVHELVRTGEYDFAANVRRYFVPALGYVALVQAVGLAAVPVGAAAPQLVFLMIPVYLLLSYLFYAAPYLLVVADASLADALARSYGWAVAGGPYFAYGAGYLLAVFGLSLVGTVAVVNLGAVGVLVGAVASAPIALALTFATTEFVAESVDGP